MKFGDNLKSIRKSKKVSQEELAEKLGVSRQSVSKWETGENYPSMQNIVCLCDIFKCKMNDLVHEDFDDLDFLDEDIKMSVVKLNEQEQSKMKVLSKILYLIGRIGAIVCRVGLGCLIAVLIALPIGMSQIDVKDDQIVVSGDLIKINNQDNGIIITLKDKDNVVITDFNNQDVENIKDAYNKHGKVGLIVLFESGLFFIGVTLVMVINLLKNLEKLFLNIHDGDTPFTLDNVSYIKKMSYFMIAAIIASAIGSTLMSIVVGEPGVSSFGLFDIVQILFVYAIACIFEYGTKIQKDSNGKMYGKEE